MPILVTSDELTSIWIIITASGVVIATIYTIIYFKIYRVDKRKVEQQVITEIINNFINPAIDTLRHYTTLQTFNFPDSLNQWMGLSLSDKNFKNQWFDSPMTINEKLYRRFSNKKKFLGWRIKTYSKFCNCINNKIRDMAITAREQNIIKQITNKAEGTHWVLQEQYENLSKNGLDDVLRKYNLISYRKDIEILPKKIPKKSIKLLKKLEKIKEKWETEYSIV